ncbi:lipoyl synthase, partial [bacterium]|nr:lipoyl synthase [bacterium]
FKGKTDDLTTVVNANPDVLNHNIETVPALYRTVRKGSLYDRSLTLLKTVKTINPGMLTKTGLMVGLGETKDQLKATFDDIKAQKVDILTLGQYLKPDKNSLDIVRYYHPDEFEELKGYAEQAGIRYVFAGPHVRSSFLAEHVFDELSGDLRSSLESHVKSCSTH